MQTEKRTVKRIAVLIRNREQQAEGLRIGMGLSGEGRHVEIFVLEHGLAPESDELRRVVSSRDGSAGFYSDNPKNAGLYGCKWITEEEIAERVKEADLVLPC